MGTPTDEDLMERFCQGDTTALDALYTRRAPELHGFLARVTGDAALAEDLLQTTFVSVIRSRDRFDRRSKVAPWLFAIAANAARDALRVRQRSPAASPEDEQALTHEADATAPADPVLRRRLEGALQSLPLAQREAVVLHHLMGFTFEELATMLGATATAVRIRAHRGYEVLREKLADLREDA
ncbi:MAG: RNA polymerase sigma factor [Deltaproteobacteria bacterium]|nr:RNA polymerase sigma factor [Deltaproteobacteria bacterium]